MTALLYYCHCGQWQRCRVEAEAGERRSQLETEADHYYMITVHSGTAAPLRLSHSVFVVETVSWVWPWR